VKPELKNLLISVGQKNNAYDNPEGGDSERLSFPTEHDGSFAGSW
jgi:hypothetical protein